MRKPRIYIRVLCVLQKVKYNRRLKMYGTMYFGPSRFFSISPGRSEDESAIFIAPAWIRQLFLRLSYMFNEEMFLMCYCV
jgi:hypothetical protein